MALDNVQQLSSMIDLPQSSTTEIGTVIQYFKNCCGTAVIPGSPGILVLIPGSPDILAVIPSSSDIIVVILGSPGIVVVIPGSAQYCCTFVIYPVFLYFSDRPGVPVFLRSAPHHRTSVIVPVFRHFRDRTSIVVLPESTLLIYFKSFKIVIISLLVR
jgi:hypothetical protein